MNNINTLTPNNIFSDLLDGSKNEREGPFWQAYDHVINGNTDAAIGILEVAYQTNGYLNRENSRITLLQQRSNYMYPVQHGMDWVNFFAQANAQDWLLKLVRAEKLEAVHAVHAMIETKNRFVAFPAFNLSDHEAQVLKELYKIEAQVINEASFGYLSLNTWLEHRQRKVEKLFSLEGFNNDAAA